MNKFFNAADAKALANVNSERIYEKEVQRIQNNIRCRSREGHLSVVIEEYLSLEISSILRENGYTVSHLGGMQPSYTIFWK